MLLLLLVLWNNPQGKQWAPPYIPFCIAWPQGHFQKRILPFLRRILTSMHSASAHLGRSPEKKTKTALLLDFVQMRGGGPCPNFLAHFHKLYFRSIWGWGGAERPLPKFFGLLLYKCKYFDL